MYALLNNIEDKINMLNKIKAMFTEKNIDVELKIDKVFDFCIENRKKEISECINKANSIKEEINEDIEQMKTISSKMRNVTQKAYSNTIRDKFCDKVENIDNIDIKDLDSLEDSIVYIDSYINDINSANIKEIIHLYSFKMFMDQITSFVKSIAEKNKKLKQISFSELNMIKANINDINNLIKENKNLKLKELPSGTEEIENDIKSILNGFEYRNLQSLISKKEKNNIEIQRIKVTLTDKISGLERTLKKHEHDNIVTKNESFLIRKYLENNIEVYNHIDEFENLLRNVKSSDKQFIIKGIIENKDLLIHLRDKMNELIDENNRIENSITRMKSIDMLIEEKKEQIEKIKRMHVQIEKENQQIKDKMQENKTKILIKKHELEQKIADFTKTHVTILINIE